MAQAYVLQANEHSKAALRMDIYFYAYYDENEYGEKVARIYS